MKPKAELGPAVFSPDWRFRYTLTRVWDKTKPTAAWIGLNPSTADESTLDPTLRRVLGFSVDWGYGSFVMLNLYAIRSTNPKFLRLVSDPVGPENDEHIRRSAANSSLIVCAWGTHGSYLRRDQEVKRLLTGLCVPVVCLGTTQAGHPKHPLYLSSGTLTRPFGLEPVS